MYVVPTALVFKKIQGALISESLRSVF